MRGKSPPSLRTCVLRYPPQRGFPPQRPPSSRATPPVIASEARQSSGGPSPAGLLRRFAPRNDDGRPSLRPSPPVIAPVTHPSLRAKRGNPGRTPLVWIASGYALAMTMPVTCPAMTMPRHRARHAPRHCEPRSGEAIQ
ncbi:MAG: hypothetical protein LBT00_09155 [Spirochaetaceae bacterium]|nr:hypothetical protein [Spirochaetaceae bacterium]